MAKSGRTEIHVGLQGRVVIPAWMRRALDITPGESLLVGVEDGRLVLEKPKQLLTRLQGRFAHVAADISLADELIAERGEEARKEAEA